MVFVKKWPLFHVFFQAIQATKMCFTIFQKKKTPVQPIKTTRSKSRKIEIFPKGLTHGFAQKYGHFSMSSFQAIQARKICFTIFYNEKTFFQAIKKRSSKSGKIEIFPKVLVTKWPFFHVCFFAVQARKMGVTIFQNKKTLSSL